MKKTLCITPLLLGSLLMLAGCDTKEAQEGKASNVGSSVEAGQSRADRLDRVTAGPAVRKTLQWFTEQPGRVVAYEEAPVLSKLAGYVDSVHCDIGDKVTKGQVLIRLRAPEYKDQVEQKRGMLVQAESHVKQAEAALVAAEAASIATRSMIALAEAGVGRAEAEYARWNSELKRIEQLVSKGSVTPKLAEETSSQFQSADATRNEALANVESAKAKHQQSESHVQTARADIEAAQAKRKVAEAELAQAETMLAYTELIAPFDGAVTSRHVDAGHYVQPAGASSLQPLMTISNVGKVRIFVNVPESQASWVDAGFGKADQGDRVTILSPSIPNGMLDAQVSRTSLQLDPQSRSMTVEIDVENEQQKILPGAFVNTKILLEQRENVLVLPIGAVVKNGDATKCCVVVNGKIEHRPIELGLRVGDEVEVKSGLDGADVVVQARAGSLEAGQAVEVISKK